MCVTFGDDQRHVLGKNQDVSQLILVRKIRHWATWVVTVLPLDKHPASHALQLYDEMIGLHPYASILQTRALAPQSPAP